MWYPFVKQEQSDDCGYACLAMLIEYYHQQKLTIGEVKHHFQNYQGALSVYSLSQIANEYNLVLTAFEINKQELSTLTFEQPLIAYVLNETGYYHYVVIYQRRGNRFFCWSQCWEGALSFNWWFYDKISSSNYFY